MLAVLIVGGLFLLSNHGGGKKKTNVSTKGTTTTTAAAASTTPSTSKANAADKPTVDVPKTPAPSSLETKDLKVGTGKETKLGDTIEVKLAAHGRLGLTGFAGTGRITMAGPGPAFRFVGTHTKTADPKDFLPAVWHKERMPRLEGLEIVDTELTWSIRESTFAFGIWK